MNSYDDGIWYHIPGFNGYQINKEGVVRSMKMMWANPGHLLKRTSNGNAYVLTNDSNVRKTVRIKTLLDLTFKDQKPIACLDDEVYLGGRNKVFNTKTMEIKPKTVKLSIMNNVVKEESKKYEPIRFYD
ncbi:MAG: hypothetical protein PHC62_00005 [Candidatus Izemoplasmatales bacterium]|nr:hypothetical protein [Candidatus Izemoplasmatales bacterium]